MPVLGFIWSSLKIKHTLHCLYIELCEESVVFGVVVFKASMLDWGGRSAYMSPNSKHPKLPFRSGGRSTWGVHLSGDLPNFWQDRVDPIST